MEIIMLNYLNWKVGFYRNKQSLIMKAFKWKLIDEKTWSRWMNRNTSKFIDACNAKASYMRTL